MEFIPAIDLLEGRVVRLHKESAVRGRTSRAGEFMLENALEVCETGA